LGDRRDTVPTKASFRHVSLADGVASQQVKWGVYPLPGLFLYTYFALFPSELKVLISKPAVSLTTNLLL
jgi:hypothetical protein